MPRKQITGGLSTAILMAMVIITAIMTGRLMSRVWNAIPEGPAIARHARVSECVSNQTKEGTTDDYRTWIIQLCEQAED